MNQNSRSIFKCLESGASCSLNSKDIINQLKKRGLTLDDPRLAKSSKLLKKKPENENITQEEFTNIFSEEANFLEHVLKNELVIPDFEDFSEKIKEIFDQTLINNKGELANYIPQLSRVDPEKFGLSITTIDGQTLHLGDSNDKFCVQSSCKPINYCLAIEEHGIEKVHEHVGHEPSGRSFNELTLNSKGLPHNPLINSGAIMCCSLIKAHLPSADRFEHVLSHWQRACSSKKIGFNNSVYLSERESADRNYALAYFMKEHKAFPKGTDLYKTLEFYFQCCSIESSTQSMSNLAATLANGGVCPFTSKRIFASSTVRNCLSLMNSCGMYDYSGEFSFNIGLPAKSGVSGVIYIVIPNTAGICIWSPRLDKHGNSVRGIEFSKKLTETFLFHNYDSLVRKQKEKINPRLQICYERSRLVQDLCFAAANGDISTIQTLILNGGNLNEGDYDNRRPLHLAVCEKKAQAVEYLVQHGANIHAKDRWGKSPLDEAKKMKSKKILDSLNSWSK